MILTIIISTLLGIVFLLVAIPFLLHVIDQDKDSKYGAIFTVESPYYQIKYFIFLLVLKLRKLRSRQPKSQVFDIKEKQQLKSIEKPQLLNGDHTIDSVYFYCTGELLRKDSTDRSYVDIVIRIARRTDRVNEFWMVVKQDQEKLLVHPNCPETFIANCSPNGWNSIQGLSVLCDRPHEKWTVKYHGWLKEVGSEGSFVHINLKLCFRAFSHIVDSHKDTCDELTADSIARERWNQQFFDDLKNFAEKNQTHYQQWGGYSGNFVLNKRDVYQLKKGKGYRDHSFGIRNWNQYQRYGVIFGYLQNGACFSLGSVCCRETLSHIRFGYLITPYGDIRHITTHNFNLWEQFLCSPPKSKILIDFTAGDSYCLEVNQSAEVDFNMNLGKSLIIERFVNFKLNGIHGKGVAEFCASDAVPRYRQIKPASLDVLKQNFPKSSKKLCLSLENEECRDRNVSGGKGSQLADLVQMRKCLKELNIPDGFVVTTESYRSFLKIKYFKDIYNFIISEQKVFALRKELTSRKDYDRPPKYYGAGLYMETRRLFLLRLPIREQLIKTNEDIRRALDILSKELRGKYSHELGVLCNQMMGKIINGKLPEDIKDAIITEFQRLYANDNQSFSIRSSATTEDAAESSSAGQMATFLGIKGFENVLESIKKCWASQFSVTAVSYRMRNGQPINCPMAVVIMEMVQSNSSGVLFTVNPITGDSTRIIISAAFGLGEVIVSGKGETDNYEIEKSPDGALKIVSKIPGNKSLRLDINQNEERVVEREVSNPTDPCLSDDDILRLGNIATLIEKCYGEPCDIEWAESGGQIFILQTRPITNLNIETDEEIMREFDTAVSYDEECLTTSNIGEMMPNATTPLTLSIFGSAIDKSFQTTMLNTGILSRYLIPRRFVCSYSNNLYLNLHDLSLASDEKNYDILFLSIVGRVLSKPSKEDFLRFTGSKSVFQRIWIFARKLWIMRRGKSRTLCWEKGFSLGYRVPLKSNPSRQMIAIMNQINDYYSCWHDTIQNTACSVMWNLILLKLLKSDKGWANDIFSKLASLLSNCSNVISADVPNTLKNISKALANNEDMKEFFLSEDEETCLDWLNNSNSQGTGELFQEFLDLHGHRCIREAEFIEKSWRKSPEKVISVIKALLRTLDPTDAKEKVNITAESAIDSLNVDCGYIKKKIMKWVLLKAREGVRSREWGKSISIQMCDAFKDAFDNLGNLMVKDNILPSSELLYFFTFDELVSVLVTKDEKISNILGRVHRRKKIYTDQMTMCLPDLCFGSPYESLENEVQNKTQENGEIILSGLPVSLGKIKAICRVISTIKEADEIQQGEILVVPYTDVGWTPYFPLLGGLITEKGSILSHGAVVAREYGLPCIVCCIGATQIFHTGDEIVLDATEGTATKSN